ncbi:MAG TPA: nucleotide-binding protein [bacterium]
MARRQAPEPPPPEIRYFTPETAESAIRALEKRVSEVDALDAAECAQNSELAHVLERKIASTVLEHFGHNSPEYREYQGLEVYGGSGALTVIDFDETEYMRLQRRREQYERGKTATKLILRGMIDIVHEHTREQSTPKGQASKQTRYSKDIVVVHGRKEGPREGVARVLTSFGLTPKILMEQPNRGQTLIEKVEAHADVGFAIILLTGEDACHSVTTDIQNAGDPTQSRLRARQNVVLELGYFIGKLGRDRVCILCEQGVEIPSDINGLVYHAIDDAGAWKFSLAKELKAASYAIDMNKLVE